ncbi:MAG TPA: SCO family protein [Phycisphaerae bacterium]|nr:SCO family protein [Phycisphaerae bacterium]
MSGMSHGWFRAQWIFSLGVALLLTSCGVASAQDAIPESQPGVTSSSSGGPPEATAGADAAGTERVEPLPEALEGVGITEHLNAKLPLDAKFMTHDRREVTLGDFFDGKRPVILVLNYYRCPMLCGLVLNGLLESLKELEWTAGEQFEIVTVSFNPFEGPELANLKRANYLADYGRPAAANGWHFLVGRKDPIQRLLDTTGFGVKRDEASDQYVHAAAIMLCTPDGRISRYLYGIVFEPRTLRLSLVEASEGKIGTTMDQLLLFCYHFEGGEYTLAAMNVARAGALLTLLILGSVLVWLWRREVDRRRAAPPRQEPGA